MTTLLYACSALAILWGVACLATGMYIAALAAFLITREVERRLDDE